MSDSAPERRFFGLRTTAAITLVSRVLGLVRDMAIASLLGLAGGGVLDAFVTAFRLPNFVRRLVAEGTLTAGFLPEFVALYDRQPKLAWRLAHSAVAHIWWRLGSVVIVAEIVCFVAMWTLPIDDGWSLTLGLSVVMLPYIVLIATAAVIAAVLRGLGEFRTPALLPVWLNVCWLLSIWFVAARYTNSPTTQAYVMAWTILMAGVVQIAAQLPALRRQGWRWPAAEPRKSRMPTERLLGPTVLAMTGLMAPQVNALVDGLTAWLLSGTEAPYPLRPGAAAATYLGERLLMFPVGLIGITVAIVVYPTLSRHSARRQAELVFDALVSSLRLVLLLAVPATFGLVLLAVPITRLLFEHGDFDADDTLRTAAMIEAYGIGVWAHSMLPVTVRSFYVLKQMGTPVLVGVAVIITNALANLVLIYTTGETGLGLATSLAAAIHVTALLALTHRAFQQRAQSMLPLATTGLKSALASAVMCLAGWATLRGVASFELPFPNVATVAIPLVVCLAVYFATARLIMPEELQLLRDRRRT